jgi:tRNA(fMet)-specific endonuclease VapC
LGVLEVLAFEAPADAVNGRIRAGLEQAGKTIGGNDLLIAAQVLLWGARWSPLTRVSFAGLLA